MYNQKLSEVKGLAIILMIVGHVIQILTPDFYDNKLFVIIYSFHMPLLMFISGYFFNISLQKYSFKEILIKKLKHILIPILFWSTPFFIHSFIKLFNSGTLSLPDLLSAFFHSYFGLWFLWSVLFNSCFVCFINKILKDKLIFHVLSIFLCLIIPFGAPYLFMFICFEIGYFLSKKDFVKIINNNLIFVSSIILSIILLFFYKSYYLCDVSGMNIFSHPYQSIIIIYRLITALIVSYCIISLFYKFPNIKVLDLFGKNTMGIYIVSMYLVTALLSYLIKLVNLSYIHIYIILISIVECFACLLITLLIKRINFLNKLIG